jgi:predicted dehydrogenase
MQAPLRTAVVGVGHFGRLHAEKLAAAEGSTLVAVVDRDEARAREVAGALGVEALGDHRGLAERVDAASVAVPTLAHHDVASDLLAQGIHVLLEKPIAETVEQADRLNALAAARGLILQVGHLERFSPAYRVLAHSVGSPLYIESHRISPFRDRGTDVDVVLDLMIHDIDLVAALVRQAPESVEAVGAPVLSPTADIVNTRLRFPGGCVANITASRVSLRTERKMRIFGTDSYVTADFVEGRVLVLRRQAGNGGAPTIIPGIHQEEHRLDKDDGLMREVESFLTAVRTGGRPVVTGEDGRAALKTALAIGESLARHRAQLESAGVL